MKQKPKGHLIILIMWSRTVNFKFQHRKHHHVFSQGFFLWSAECWNLLLVFSLSEYSFNKSLFISRTSNPDYSPTGGPDGDGWRESGVWVWSVWGRSYCEMVKGKKTQTTWNHIPPWDILGPVFVDKSCGIQRKKASYIIVFRQRLILLLYVKHWGRTEGPEYSRKQIKYRYFIISLECLIQCLQDATDCRAVSFKVF